MFHTWTKALVSRYFNTQQRRVSAELESGGSLALHAGYRDAGRDVFRSTSDRVRGMITLAYASPMSSGGESASPGFQANQLSMLGLVESYMYWKG
ncbi:hypothetical protein NDU88_006169 [Pleurodeles waltl]|uniref:Uncharacterized protein n=1 Tax=Pleurodeles waltl TaxID=8319 RepID=A0AAV7WDH7_PLEWA|nr:hypothetical protein NDU88_006169 [Pleurodeles waltl]